jgi:hypothetical protein
MQNYMHAALQDLRTGVFSERPASVTLVVAAVVQIEHSPREATKILIDNGKYNSLKSHNIYYYCIYSLIHTLVILCFMSTNNSKRLSIKYLSI